MEVMGHPEAGLNYIHIAGTNGKGSTGLIIASILMECGCKVGTYSSPHLHSYTERFRINGEAIPIENLKERIGRMSNYVEEMTRRKMEAPSEFEILTALGFQYFQDEQPDIVVLEVGMGGIYDTTNVVDPLVSIITGIDYDHTDFLGNTLAEIASNKAGIIKPDRPVVVGPMAAEAFSVIAARANAVQAPLYSSTLVGIESLPEDGLRGQRVNISYGGDDIRGVRFSLAGIYQLTNLALALTTLLILQDNLGITLSRPSYPDKTEPAKHGIAGIEAAVRLALDGIQHPGRLEVVSKQPLVIVDAAHNPQGTRALAESLDRILPGRKRVLVCGWLNDKDVKNSLQPLGENTRFCIVTRPEGARGTEWQRVAGIWQELFPHKGFLVEENISKAAERGLDLLHGNEYLLITGSFYVLDRARSYLLEGRDKLSIS